MVAVFEYVWTDGILVKRHELDIEDPDAGSGLKTGIEEYTALESASASETRLTGHAWLDERYRHIAVFDHLSQRDRDLVDPGSAERHLSHLNEEVHTCLYGVISGPEPRFLLRFINRSGEANRSVPFVSEKTRLDELLADLRSELDSVTASARTRALENATRLAALNAGDAGDFVAALAPDLMAEHVDSFVVVSHQAGTTHFGRLIAQGNDVAHIRVHGRPWAGDQTYDALLKDVGVWTRPTKVTRTALLAQATAEADAVLSLPFHVGNTTGTMLIPFALGFGAGQDVNAIVGAARLGLLRAYARLVGDAIDSTLSRRLAEGARHALGALGHELASPLAILGSSAEESLDGIRALATQSQDESASAEDLREIRALASAGLERVHDSRESAAAAMAVAQIVAEENDGRMELQFTKFGLADLILRAIEQVEQERVWRIGRRIYDFEPKESVVQLGETVGDSRLITAALKNLLRNAAKFSMTQGSSSCTIEVFAERQTNMDILIVRNWGRSIDPEDREIIFEPWVRIDTDSEVARRGMGLGLFLARRIAMAHGGSVLCRKSGTSFTLSHQGHETEFEFRLPNNLTEGAYYHRWKPGEPLTGPQRQPRSALTQGGVMG